jgi:predicted enzyme related to lactoylglutathione lyase
LTERDGYEHGVPCWVDTWQEDPDTAATFYAGVFGWDMERGTPPGADTRYYMCRLGGSDVAAIGSPPPAGMPTAWTTYVWVDDADAVAASAVKAGRSLRAEPFGSLDGGRPRCGRWRWSSRVVSFDAVGGAAARAAPPDDAPGVKGDRVAVEVAVGGGVQLGGEMIDQPQARPSCPPGLPRG